MPPRSPWCYVLLLQLLIVIFSYRVQTFKVPVGILEGPEDDPRQNDKKFWSFGNYTSPILLDPVVERISWWESLQITRAVCTLLKSGVHTLVSHAPPRLQPILSSYSNHFKLPLLTDDSPSISSGFGDFQVTMIPSSVKAVGDLLKHYNWESFVFLYDDDSGPLKLQKILEATDFLPDVEALWRVYNGEEAQRYLQLVKRDSRDRPQCVLAATNEHLVDEIIATLQSGNGINRKFHVVLTEPVAFVEEGNHYGASGSYLVTKLSFTNPKEPAFRDLENRWATMFGHQRLAINSKSIPDSAILTHDIMNVLQLSYNHLLHDDAGVMKKNDFSTEGLDCLQDGPKSAEYGLIAANYIKKTVLDPGITGKIKFNDRGERVDYTFDIMETTSTMTEKIGTWSTKSKLQIFQDPSTREQKDDSTSTGLDDRLKRKAKLVVTSILSAPYFMMNDDADIKKGNDRYRGYAKDLMDELANVLGWEYEFQLVKDGKYGMYNSQLKKWEGMIGELVREEADMAVASLTVTPFRQEVADFSKSFQSVGLNILIKKPSELSIAPTLGPLSFVEVWSYDIWLLLTVVFLVLGGANYAVSHFTGDPDRIRSLDTKGSDSLSPCSSYWFTFGAMVFRGTGIYPRSISHRLLSIVWWGFSLAVLVVYICSLNFMMIRARTETQSTVSMTSSSDILKSCIEKGHPKIGVVAYGSTHQFFQNSQVGLYKEYGRYLFDNPGVLVRKQGEAIERIRSSNGSYAVIMESTTSEFISNNQPCDMAVSSGFLDTKKFGVAFKKGSPLRESVDHALLSLMESGALRNMYEKWWHLQSSCDDPHHNILPSIYTNSLSLHEVSGVFYLLILSVVLASVAAVSEYFIRSKRLMVDK